MKKILNQPQDKMDGLIIMGKCKKEVLDILKNRFKGVAMIVRNHADYGVDEVLLGSTFRWKSGCFYSTGVSYFFRT